MQGFSPRSSLVKVVNHSERDTSSFDQLVSWLSTIHTSAYAIPANLTIFIVNQVINVTRVDPKFGLNC